MIKILYPGRVSPIKDVPTLVQAVRILHLKLIINNSYTYNEIPKLFRSADLIVVPTLSKALDKVFLEALICGVPAIGSDLGYPFMTTKFPQLIFEAGNPRDLAQKIKWLVNHPQQTRKIVSSAQQFVRKNFDLENLIDKIVVEFEKNDVFVRGGSI